MNPSREMITSPSPGFTCGLTAKFEVRLLPHCSIRPNDRDLNFPTADVEHGNARSTGQFNYTFSVPKDIKVMPHSYQEYMMYIDARRRVKLGDIQSRQEQTDSAEERKQLTDDANLTE